MMAEEGPDLGGWEKPLRVKDEGDKIIVDAEIKGRSPDEINVAKKGSELVIEGQKPHERHDLRLPEDAQDPAVSVESSETGVSVVVPKTPREGGDRTKDSQQLRPSDIQEWAA